MPLQSREETVPIYKAPVDDVLFLLTDVFQIGRYDNLPGFSDASPDLLEAILREAARLCEEVVQPLNRIGDKEGCKRHDDGSVTTPKGFKEAFKQYSDGGWMGISAPPEFGGQGLPETITTIVNEFLCSASMAFGMYPGLTQGAIAAILTHGAPAGIKGTTLFVVPKILPNADGALGARNAVACGSIEEKMGIHANSTCVMNYDGATGFLIGEENRGINAMFTMMNEARLGVGVQGLAVSEVAYQNAAAYAKDRLQGRALTGAKFPDKTADPLIVHPDVRRMLMTMRAFNEAGRALLIWTALQGDVVHRSPDDKARQAGDDHMGLLTPVLKAVLTDQGFANAVQA